jgi:hypothetical protein
MLITACKVFGLMNRATRKLVLDQSYSDLIYALTNTAATKAMWAQSAADPTKRPQRFTLVLNKKVVDRDWKYHMYAVMDK